MIFTNICTRFYLGYVRILAIIGVDTSRDVDYVRGWNSGFPIYTWCFGLTTTALTCDSDSTVLSVSLRVEFGSV